MHLSYDQQESVCYQCHLQATARVLRPGRSHLDFRPGMKLEDIWAIMDAGVDISDSGETRAVNHIQQMRSSLCYQESEPRMGCISCHDPHAVPAEHDRRQYYRSRCLECHQLPDCLESQSERNSLQDSCIECHMPRLDSGNISHVSQTDHRILKRRQSSSGSGHNQLDHSHQGASVLKFFDNLHERIPQWESRRAMAAAVWMDLNKKGQQVPATVVDLLEPSLQVYPEDSGALTLLGALAQRQNQVDTAISYFNKALQLPDAEESAVLGLMEAYYSRGQWAEAYRYSLLVTKLDPGHAGAYAIRADSLARLERFDEAIESGEQCLDLNPSLTAVREWLTELYRRTGHTKQYEEAARMLNRVHSAKVPLDRE